MSALAPTLQAFFTQRLMAQRHASAHTVTAYRDTFRLLLVFASKRLHRPPSSMRVEDFDAALVARFLDYIEKPRPFKDLAMHDVNIRILSDVALIHGRATYNMLADGEEQEALYTDAYQKRDGAWVCVAACCGMRCCRVRWSRRSR